MSQIKRQRKIDFLLQHAKTIEPKIREQTKKKMQQEIEANPAFQYITEKPTINETEFEKRVKHELKQELMTFALLEFPENNRKTLKEYVERAMMQLEQ